MENKLKYALLLSLLNFTIEIIAGILTSSLALLSDAVHVFTDASALTISLLAIRIGRRATDSLRTYGYRRFEIIAAAVNSILLFLASLFILYHAYQRFLSLPQIHANYMLVVAVISLLINILSTRLLYSGSKTSLNIKAAYIDSLADLVSSVGVIIAALIIRFTGWVQIDPLIAVLIGIWILPRCWTLLAESVNILLEGVPPGTDLTLLSQQLSSIPGIIEVHDLHVWSITSGVHSLTAHLVVEMPPKDNNLLRQAQEIAALHAIKHTNFQIEVCEHMGGFCQHDHG